MTVHLDYGDIQRREYELALREKHLMRQEKLLQKNIKKFKKKIHLKADSNLAAAKKLERARKTLELTLGGANKLQRCKKKHCTKRCKEAKAKNKKSEKVKQKSPQLSRCNGFLRSMCTCSGHNRDSGDRKSYVQRICDYERKWSCKMARKVNGLNSFRTSRQPRRHGFWDGAAGDCYLMALRRPPRLHENHRWPQFYPQYLSLKQAWKNMGHVLLFLSGILIWTPCILLCKCLFCVCCTDSQ